MTKNSVFVQIYEVVKKIPKGKVATYGQISGTVNSLSLKKVTPRVVGWALHANINSKIPCHRVVSKEGKVAVNYAFGGWKKQKEKLIKEGIVFENKMHINLSKYGIMEL